MLGNGCSMCILGGCDWGEIWLSGNLCIGAVGR